MNMHSNRLIIFLAAATWAAHVLHARDQLGRREEGEECYLEWRRCRSRWWRWCRGSRLWWWLRSPVALLFFFFFPVAETPLFLLSSSSVPLCNLLYYSSVFYKKKKLSSPLYALSFSSVFPPFLSCALSVSSFLFLCFFVSYTHPLLCFRLPVLPSSSPSLPCFVSYISPLPIFFLFIPFFFAPLGFFSLVS